MKNRLFLLGALFLPLALHAEPAAPAPAPAPVAEKPADKEAEKKEEYIRVTETDRKPTALQTAVVRLTKGDATVELVGAIHIADKKYYQALGKRFEGYQALLWEGIGGSDAAERAAAKAPAEEEAAPEKTIDEGEKKKKPERLSGLHTAYESAAKYLDLAYQMKEIDYSKANFVHADLTMEEFGALQEQRGESLFTFMLKAGWAAEKSGAAKEPNSFKLLASLIRGDKAGIKRELVHTLGAGDDQVAALAGDSVIISDRNAKCLEVLARELKAGKTELGIFYGAAHFPDMVKRLAEQGWTVAGTEWMTAWELGAAP